MSVKWARIDEALERVAIPTDIDPHQVYPYVGVRSFGRGLIEYPPVLGNELSKLKYFSLPPNALIISNIKAWEGAVALTGHPPRDAVVSSRFLTYMPRVHIDVKYVLHYLVSQYGVDALSKASPGSADRNRTLGAGRFQELILPLPSLATQRSIAARLDRMARSVQRVQAVGLGDDAPDAVAPSLVSRLLKDVHLPSVPVGELYDAISDVVHPGEDLGDASRFVGLEHIKPHVGVAVGQAGTEDLKGRKLRFRKGDVLYGYLRPYLNKVWIADGPGLCSVEQYVLRPAAGVDPRLLGHVLRSGRTLEAVNAATHNLQLPRIRSGLLAAIEVPDIRLAPTGLADRLDSINARANAALGLVARSRKLIDSLLPAARNEEFRKLLDG